MKRSYRLSVACRANRAVVEPLERRTFLTAVLVQPIGNQVFAQDSGVEQADFYGVFADNIGANDLTFSATSSNPSVLTASVSGEILTITPVAGQSGFAQVHMAATDPGGTTVSNSFRVQVTAADNRALDVLLGAGSPSSIHYVQSSGAAATVTLIGPGSAVLHFGGDGLSRAGTNLNGANAEMESITLSDTTTATTLNVSGQKASPATVGHIAASGSLGHLNLKSTVLEGDVNITGSLPAIDVDFAQGGSFTIGSGGVSILGQSFVDENFSAPGAVNSIKLAQWTNSDNVAESFTGAFVRTLTVHGNFTPGLQLSGVGAPGRTLGSAKILGAVGGTWVITGASAPLTVGTTQSDWNATFDALPSFTSKGDLIGHLTAPTIRSINVRSYIGGASINLTAPGITDVQSIKARALSFSSVIAAGNIGTVTVKLMQYTSLFAGIAATPLYTLPTSASDIVATASIKSVNVTGGVTANDFINSFIAASALGTLQLSDSMLSNNGFTFGVTGNSIASLQFVAGKKKIVLKDVHDASTLAAQLAAQNASLGDMTVLIV